MAEPFNLAVIGDSILWGVGLRDREKIHRRVANVIARDLDREVHIRHFAHVGATLIGDCDREATAGSGALITLKQEQELVSDSPSVTCQGELLKGDDPHSIDLVLLDGGINDIGLNAITLIPLVFTDKGFGEEDDFIARVDDICNAAMTDLLIDLGHALLKAKFVVTGYYPIFSNESRGNIDLILLICAALAPGGLIGEVLAAITLEVTFSAIIDALKKRSNLWRRESDKAYRAAVQSANDAFAGGPNRFAFATPKFEAENCVLASRSLLFGAKIDPFDDSAGDPLGALDPVDPLAAHRLQLCKDARPKLEKAALTQSRLASVAHPDPSGAATYDGLILARLREMDLLPIFVANKHTREVHDLRSEWPRCQINRMKQKHKVIFKTLRQAHEAGFDNCAWCIGGSRR